MKAMLLCAGLGTRLGELGELRPKPMFPVCGRPILEYGIANLVGLVEEPLYPLASWLLERVVFQRRFRDEPDLFHRSQPLTYLSDKSPPILLIHGENDSLVPIEEARHFFAKLGHAGATRIHLCEVPLAVHAFEIVPSPLHQRAVRIIRSFMDSL